MTAVKICGINDSAAFDAAVSAGADWLGFNFFPPSPRYVTPAQAAMLSARHQGGPLRVGLFVEPVDGEIERCLEQVRLDVLQVYAEPGRMAALGARFGLPVWRSLGVASAADLPRAAPGIDGLVIESKPPPGATRPGGNATAMEWTLLTGWTSPCPWLLAGGLTPGNVAEAIRVTQAPAVDVSSGVEIRRGVKDAGLIRAFITAAKDENDPPVPRAAGQDDISPV